MFSKKLFSIALILPLLTNTPGVQIIQIASKQPQVEARVIDQKARVLKAYFERHDSPLQYHAQDFIDAADQYSLDWRLVPAIAGVESTFGKAIPGGFNAWGWGVYGTQAIYFDSWRQGIFTVSEGLRKNYFDKGLDNPYSINRIYATSPTWGSKVSFFLEDIEGFSKRYHQESPELVKTQPIVVD